MADIFILGAGGHGVSVANVAAAAGHRLLAFLDDRHAGGRLLGLDILTDATLDEHPEALAALALGANASRQRLADHLRARHPDSRFPALVHPSACIGFHTTLGAGTVVMPNATVGPNTRVGAFCIVNTNAVLDHDGVMDDFASLGPGAIVGGRVRIGARSAVSIGATVRHEVTIGADTVLGGAAYLDRDIGDGVVAWGVPARVRRSRLRTDPYL
ncbi:MAG: acetyltransferase [Paracoccaceae bacterium]